jgi:hypothetical protein
MSCQPTGVCGDSWGMTHTPWGAQQPDRLDHPTGSSRWSRGPNKKLLAAAAAVALVVAAGVIGAVTIRPHDDNSAGPAATPTTPSPFHSYFDSYLKTATDFVDALSSFNLPQARRLLAPGATFTGGMDTKSWPEDMRFFQQTGGQILPGRCHVLQRGLPENLVVGCPYSYQLMRSAALGLGPYTGSHLQLTFGSRRITQVNVDHETDTNGWSTQMWLPFAAWIDRFHHRDGHKMYPDWPQQHHFPATNQEIRLWSERTRQFVRYVRHLCNTPRGDHAAVCSGQPTTS